MIKQFETIAPFFPGFYESVYSPDFEYAVNFYDEKGENPDDIYDKFDNDSYMQQVAINFLDAINSRLSEIKELKGVKYEFETVYTPKAYNYETDQIYCKLAFPKGKRTIKNLVNLLKSQKSDFQEYLKDNYSSYPGFVSFIPTNADSFLKSLAKKNPDQTLIRVVIEYLLLKNNKDCDFQESLYYETTEYYSTTELTLDCIND